MSERSSLQSGDGPHDSSAPQRSVALLTATVCLLGAGLGVSPQPSRADTPPPIRWGGAGTAGVTQAATAQSPASHLTSQQSKVQAPGAVQLTSQQSKVQAPGAGQHTSPSLVSSQHKWSAGLPSPNTRAPATNHAKWRGATNASVVSPASHRKAAQTGPQGSK
jgi:hypothetical protein